MAKNPYSNNNQLIMANGAPLENGGKEAPRAMGYTRTGARSESEMPLVGSNMEFNIGGFGKVSNTQDAMLNIKTMQNSITAGRLRSNTPAEIVAQRNAKFKQAYADKRGNGMELIGATMVENIYESLGREAFARKVLQFGTVGDKETIRHKIIRKDIGAVASNNDIQAIPNIVKQDYIYPGEFILNTRILIEDKEIKQAGEEILEEKYNDGLEAIMTAEDRVLYRMLNTAAGLIHDEIFFATLTPTIFSTMRTNIQSYGNIATNCVFSFDLWDDVLTDTEFATWFDPVNKYNLIMEGSIGRLMGVNLITDGFRHPNLKVLNTGEIFMLADPKSLGSITERQALKSKDIDLYNLGEAKRGWFLTCIEAMTIGNPLGVVHGQRV